MHEHDVNRISIDTFDRIAERYDARNRAVTMYDDSNAVLCDLRALGRTFHGVACAFGLPYLTPPDAARFVADAAASSSRAAR